MVTRQTAAPARGAPRWPRTSVLSLGLGVTLATCAPAPGGAPDGDQATVHRLAVIPFHTDSSRRDPMARALADSLAGRLAAMPDLAARVGTGDAEAEFVVRGELAGRDGRLVIAARLHGAPRDSTLWTATFWRADSLTTALVADLSAGVAEAIYGHMARNPTTTRRDTP